MAVAVVSSVITKLRKASEPGIFLLVRLSGHLPPADRILVEVREAVGLANAEAASRTVEGGFTTMTERGPAIHIRAAPMVDARQRAAVRRWLATVADHLTAAGLDGKVGTPGTWYPSIGSLTRASPRTFPAAFIGYRLDNWAPWGERSHGWQVAEATTSLVAERFQLQASTGDGTESWAALGGTAVPIPPSEIVDYLTTTAASVRDDKSLYVVAGDKSAFTRHTLSSHGQCVSQTVDPAKSWRTRVQDQIERLMLVPEAVDVAMVKNSWGTASDWSDANLRDHHPTVCDPLDYLLNRHLWGEYVVDAAGVNLLTGQHIEHARDLSDWTVDEVAPDRFLVSARDLEAWFSGISASPEVIEKARTDFGDMILSGDTILAKPGPYTRTHRSAADR